MHPRASTLALAAAASLAVFAFLFWSAAAREVTVKGVTTATRAEAGRKECPAARLERLSSGWDDRAQAIFDGRVQHLNSVTSLLKVTPPGDPKVTFRALAFREYSPHFEFWGEVNKGSWEPDTFARFRKGLDKETTLVDFGTWIGPTLLFGAQLARRAFGIEADPAAFAGVTQNVNINLQQPWATRVHVQPACVGVTESVLEMKSRNPGNSESSLGSVFRQQNVAELPHWNVRCYPLERLFQHWGIDPDTEKVFIKCDVESYECNLLPSWQAWFKRLSTKPTLHLATHSQISKCSAEQTKTMTEIAMSYRYRSANAIVNGVINPSAELVLSDTYQP